MLFGLKPESLKRKNLCWTNFDLRSMKYNITAILNFFERSL